MEKAGRVSVYPEKCRNMNKFGKIKDRYRFWNTKLVILSVLAAFIIAALAGCGAKMPKGYTIQKEKLLFVSDRENDLTKIVLDTKCLDHSIEGTVYTSMQALDKTAAAALTTGKALFYVTESGAEQIAGNVSLYNMAASGDSVAYIDAESSLYLYNTKDGETEKLAETAEGYLAISPDGKTVLYDVFQDDGYYELYLYHNGETTLLGENLFGLAVADKASYIYVYDAEQTLYVIQDGAKTTLGERTETTMQNPFVFNRDLSQILYNASGSVYISQNGGEGKKVADNIQYALPVTPNATGMMYRYEKNSTVIFQMETFGGAVLMDSNQKLHTLSSDTLEETGIAFQVEDATVSADGSRLLYMKLGGIHTSDMKTPEETKIVQGISEAAAFVVTKNGKTLYYCESDGTLMRRATDSEDEPEKIAEDVIKLYVTPNKDTVLFVTGSQSTVEGELYAVKDGGTAKKLLDNVATVEVYYQSVYCYVNNGTSYDLYAGAGDDRFDMLIENAIVIN